MNARTIGIYGQSNASKSSQCYHLAKWYIERFGRKIRWVNADNGGGVNYVIDSGLVDSGWVDVLDISQLAPQAMSVVAKLSEGYWPKSSKFDKSTANAWSLKDNVGMYIIEGGTSIADLIGRGIRGGTGKIAFGKSYDYKEDDYNFGGLAMQHIGMIQPMVIDAIVRFRQLASLDYVVWTFHETKSEEKISQASLIGPCIIGNAITPFIPKEFTMLFHLQREEIPLEAGGSENRAVLYMRDHPDPQTSIPCKAKITLLPEMLGVWEQRYPSGKAVLSYERGIMDIMDSLLKVQEGARKFGEKFLGKVNTTTDGRKRNDTRNIEPTATSNTSVSMPDGSSSVVGNGQSEAGGSGETKTGDNQGEKTGPTNLDWLFEQ